MTQFPLTIVMLSCHEIVLGVNWISAPLASSWSQSFIAQALSLFLSVRETASAIAGPPPGDKTIGPNECRRTAAIRNVIMLMPAIISKSWLA